MFNVQKLLKQSEIKKSYILYEIPNFKQKKRNVLILHHGDLDGSGIVLLYKIFKYYTNKFRDYDLDNVKYILCPKEADSGLNEVIANGLIDNYTDIIICDISVKDKDLCEYLDTLNNNGVNVVLLDHHSSAIELNKYSWAYVKPFDLDNNIVVSGTSLAFKLFIPLFKEHLYNETYNMLNKFSILVSDWDTFNWKRNNNLEAKKLNNIFIYYGLYDFTDAILCNMTMRFKLLTEKEETINEVTEKKISDSAKKLMYYMQVKDVRCDNRIYKFGYIITDNNVSNIADYIFENYEGQLDIIVAYNIYYNAFSFRARSTNNKVNLVNLAKQFSDGTSFGGHPTASGCTNKQLANNIFEYLNECHENIQEEDFIK